MANEETNPPFFFAIDTPWIPAFAGMTMGDYSSYVWAEGRRKMRVSRGRGEGQVVRRARHERV